MPYEKFNQFIFGIIIRPKNELNCLKPKISKIANQF